jgi:hypothetical protein
MTDISERLALSARHLLTAERLIAEQTARINRLLASGQDIRQAWKLLVLFEDVQSEMAKHQRSISRDVEIRKERQRRAAVALPLNCYSANVYRGEGGSGTGRRNATS